MKYINPASSIELYLSLHQMDLLARVFVSTIGSTIVSASMMRHAGV